MIISIYTDNPKYEMHRKEYEIIWENEGKRITQSFEKILGVPFIEKEIKLLINEGKNNSNSSGDTVKDIMHFRYNNRCKIGTFLHELSHRIIMEHNLLEKAKRIYDIKDIHEIVDLFLYDVIEDLYGKDTANLRVEYESNFEELVYKDSWEEALKLSYKERQNKLQNIIKVEFDEKE